MTSWRNGVSTRLPASSSRVADHTAARVAESTLPVATSSSTASTSCRLDRHCRDWLDKPVVVLDWADDRLGDQLRSR